MKKIIVTIGPATRSEEIFQKVSNTDASFVRVNMSHASLDELEETILMAQKHDVPFILDTEGSQIRTGDLYKEVVQYKYGELVKIWDKEIVGDENNVNLRPSHFYSELNKGDLVFLDFNSLMLRIENLDDLERSGFITARVITEGSLGRNKSAVINQTEKANLFFSILSEKDKAAIKIALRYNIKHIAASFIRNEDEVKFIREITGGSMEIISKIETSDALINLDSILKCTDSILIDRGDLSKEIPMEKIPLTQKIILKRARELNKPAFVATNLLESMIHNNKPTRAELNDIVTSIIDGASGLALCAETAIGKYPIETINTLSKVINETEILEEFTGQHFSERAYDKLMEENYLEGEHRFSLLIEPHGGKLVNRIAQNDKTTEEYKAQLTSLKIDSSKELDLEQIAIGGYSPLKGFMNKMDFESVLNNMTLADQKTVWTIPIVLDVDEVTADKMSINDTILLEGENGGVALMTLNDIYTYNKKETMKKWYGTDDIEHPGVQLVEKMRPILLGGDITLLKRSTGKFKEYEMTPAQVRRIYDERGWTKVVGFHTRNIPHRGHEFVQMDALKEHNCDGILIHPVIGKKKNGDFLPEIIVESYETLIDKYYPKEKVLFGVWGSYPRYSGPREAVFTAICRKNYGCSHFIVGRDHAGVGNYYGNLASQEIFQQIGEIDIQILTYSNVSYYADLKMHAVDSSEENLNKWDISATSIREFIAKKETPPDWLMRPELSDLILGKDEVFVCENKNTNIIWFTGLSGAGKTAIAMQLHKELLSMQKSVKIIDGDVVRDLRNSKNTFEKAEIRENNIFIAELCKKHIGLYDYVLVPVISPIAEYREEAKNVIGQDHFTLLHIATPIDTCIERDVKGLYKKAQEGVITNMIGFHENYPYEAPLFSDIRIETNEKSIKSAALEVLAHLTLNVI